MKKLVLLACMATGLLFSCNNQSKSEEQDQHTADSLKIATVEGQRDSLMSLVGEISQSLIEANRLEGVMASQNFQQETPERKQEIFNNLDALKQTLQDRRKRLEELEAKLKKSGSYNNELKKTIESQKALIEEQSHKIQEMQQQLDDAMAKIGSLTSSVDSLNTRVNDVTAEKLAAEQRSEALSNEMNTCYYVIGSNQELKEHNILEKKFLSKTKVMENDFDRDYFTKADKRTLREIQTYSSRAKILTKQPVNSYSIEEEDGYKVIKITNATLFWEKSNFLVIETK